MAEFKEFPKLYRLNREWIATEKIDGTNACVVISDDGIVSAQSRTRAITPTDDNYGFAKWVESHQGELLAGLGPGYHYGEWWGQGIQRRYGLAEKRFSLFNVSRWTDDVRPPCCHVVPTLGRGADVMELQAGALAALGGGSLAAPGFKSPEGIVLFHTPSGHSYKVTFGGDGHKGEKQ